MISILTTIALIISFLMALYLFSYSYIEGLRISNAEEKVEAGTFIFMSCMAFVFSGFTYIFI
ncbi:hypothetical protein D4T97_004285 [Siminovitchia acidinfaciens]|uniref:Uncharacterized protein n=1 Tax=Siminovitchia acidinfaciens TaxID=2321395 RepID=A0A429Y8I5_9BACI|nr:hypothetical protein D4T97_004285 [Siminovitchia acidinfaciens]